MYENSRNHSKEQAYGRSVNLTEQITHIRTKSAFLFGDTTPCGLSSSQTKYKNASNVFQTE